MKIPFTDKEADLFESIENEIIMNWFESAENRRIAEYEFNRIHEGYDIPTKIEYNKRVNKGFLIRGDLIHD